MKTNRTKTLRWALLTVGAMCSLQLGGCLREILFTVAPFIT